MMNRFKLKTLLLFGLVSSAFAYDVTNEEIAKAYKMGAYHAVGQIDVNMEVQGYEETKIKFDNYIVAMNINKLSKWQTLIFQGFGYQESLSPVIVKGDYLVFSSFDRKADAEFTANEVLNKLYFGKEERKAIVIDNTANKTYTKIPFMYKKAYEKMYNDLKDKVKGKVYIIKEKKEETKKEPVKLEQEIKKPIVKEKKKTVKKSISRPMLYAKLKYDKIEKYKYNAHLPNFKSIWKDKLFVRANTIENKGQLLKYKSIIKSDYGKYIKLYNKAYFVDVNDVVFVEK